MGLSLSSPEPEEAGKLLILGNIYYLLCVNYDTSTFYIPCHFSPHNSPVSWA